MKDGIGAGAGQADRFLSRPTLQARARQAAGGFAGMGLGAGDTVALLMRNDLAFLEASLAAAHIGAYAVPLNWHATAADVAYILQDCQAKALVAHADKSAARRAAAE